MALKRIRRVGFALAATAAGVTGLALVTATTPTRPAPKMENVVASTKTPIQHLVVIFQENESFDNEYGTYPVASNPSGEDLFTALPGTPSVNGLVANSLNGNVNYLANNPNGANPARLDPGPNASGVYNATLDSHGANAGIDSVLTCQQNHNYEPEQQAVNGGAMNNFPNSVGEVNSATEPGEPGCTANQDLDYYDGNTVTGYWNYAQHYAMSDNYFGTTYGPSTPGAINVISGDTGNFNLANGAATTPGSQTDPNTALVPDGDGAFSDINDSDPYYDDCSSTTSNIGIQNYSGTGITDPNIGDLLNEANISWGWFEGGFAPTTAANLTAGPTPAGYAGGPGGVTAADRAVCGQTQPIGAALGGDGGGGQGYGFEASYIQHHQPFQYYASTANPRHILPTSLSAVGTDTQSWTGGSYGVGTPEFNTANHQYDITDFNDLITDIDNGSMSASALPAVSYLKAPAYEDEHPDYSDPVDGQHFVTTEINKIMSSPDWSSTAIVVTYDDSDGWYDHVWSGAQNSGAPQNASAAVNATSGTVLGTGDDETANVCGGTPLTGTTIPSSGIGVALGTNDTINYTIGSTPGTLTVPAATYTPSTLATAIDLASGNKVIVQANTTTNKLVATDNGLQTLAFTGGDGLSTAGFSASGSSVAPVPTLTNDTGQPENGRCGFGPRLPLLVISPYAKKNYVSNTLADQASIVNFIEYNWGAGTIAGSAAQLLTNPSNTFDLANMFDFASGATDTAGTTPYLLNTSTFQPANPTINWSTPSAITYGQPLTATQLGATSPVSGTFSYSTAIGTVLSAGTHTVTVTFTPSDSTTWNADSQTDTITVNPAPLTVTASSVTVKKGTTPVVTPSYSGFVNGDTAANLTTLATCTTPASGASLGAFPATCSGAAGANYVLTFVPGAVTVSGAIPGLPASKESVTNSGVEVTLHCSAVGGPCATTITLEIKQKVGKLTEELVLGTGSGTVASGKAKTVDVKLTAAGEKLLGHLKKGQSVKVTEVAKTKTATTERTVTIV